MDVYIYSYAYLSYCSYVYDKSIDIMSYMYSKLWIIYNTCILLEIKMIFCDMSLESKL